ncbi:MAG TPA: methionine synthase [Chloroflexia bacterium]|nr:methionine synthase [Chloroflexia bacterium]
MTKKPYLESLSERVLVFDGAMGTSVQALNLTPEQFGGPSLEGCNDYLCVTNPSVIEGIHASYMEAGADVLETATFGSTRPKLDEYGIGEEVYRQNFTAAQLARRVADNFSTPSRPRYVAGSMGPTGFLPSASDPVLSAVTYRQLKAIYKEQARPLVEGGVDLLVMETMQDILELKAAIAGAVEYFRESGRRVPIQAQVTLDTSGRMLLGTDIVAALTTLHYLPVDIIGLNCSTGPEHMREPIRFLAENSTRPVSCIPNAGLPINVGGQAVYPLEPDPMAHALHEFVSDLGASVVGGCCGTGPDHIRALVEALGTERRQRRRPSAYQPRVSSGMRAIPLEQVPAPLIVGERVNAQGSRKVKRLLLAEDYDAIVDVGREQVDGGAHVLDVQVAVTERQDEDAQMRTLVKKLGISVEAPLMIDSTEPSSMQAALEVYPGRAILNSINMERGRERIDAVLPMAVEHGAAVVALAIDEIGMAHTADRKVEICKRIHDIVTGEYGLEPGSLIFDVLTFPVTTGQEDLAASALETLEGIRRVKSELPGVYTVLGVSNVSFGIDPYPRAVLNSVFLHHAVEAGLDLAIVNPAHITPYAEVPEEERRLADRLINNEPGALPEYIAYFEANKAQGSDEGRKSKDEDLEAAMTVEQRIHHRILHRKKEGIEALLDESLQTHDPVWVLNNVLLPAMKDVGDKFGAGELILPFVLQSAEVMKRAVAHLEQFFEKKEGYTKGKVVLATVFGDVHDIGKSLVNTILTNNGYTVYDLGKQVPINVIIDKAVEVDATAIGLSALLVSTSKQMPLAVQELDKRGLDFPVLVGGAAINRPFGARIGFVDDDRRYGAGVYYCRDAFEGLDTMEALTDESRRADYIEKRHNEARLLREREAHGEPDGAAESDSSVRSNVDPNAPIPTPPFWGYKVLGQRHIPLDEVFECLDLKSLFRLSWGAHKLHGADYDRAVDTELMPRLKRMQSEMRSKQYLTPKVIYGYFPAQSEGNDLIVYDPEGVLTPNGKPIDPAKLRPITRFTFPRQPDRERLCLADYFASVASGRVDVVPLQVVTMGDRASEVFLQMQREGDYSEGYYIYGLSVSLAEALAEWTHGLVKRELGLPEWQGRRYSWGYPACPDPSEQVKLLKVLPSESAIGVSLTEGFVLVPEQSTAAMVVHHPEAKYYTTRPLNKGARPPAPEEEEEAGRNYFEPGEPVAAG